MKLKPLADRVLIKPAPAEETTLSGIIIPDSAKEKPLKGSVLAAGEGTKDEKMILKEGDTVLYGKYAGTEIELEGEKYLIMFSPSLNKQTENKQTKNSRLKFEHHGKRNKIRYQSPRRTEKRR